ncbi:MAG: hypothetical protein V1882_06810 [Candidatus Omnitrophota bacterium]
MDGILAWAKKKDMLYYRPSLYFFSFMVPWAARITFVFQIKENQCRFVEMDTHWDRS